jgi:hypothetical protein
VVSFSRGAFRARLGRKLLWRAPRSVLGTAWVRWNLSSKGGVWGSLGPPSFLLPGRLGVCLSETVEFVARLLALSLRLLALCARLALTGFACSSLSSLAA